MRQGISLLWEPRALASVAEPRSVCSIRQFFALQAAWPESLPSVGGDALVVAGLEGCLDALTEEDAVEWLESDFRSAVLRFQEHYEGKAALILWLPSGRKRVSMEPSTQEHFWSSSPGQSGQRIALGRALWGGAESDVARILVSSDKHVDPDGESYVGLHLPRIS
jgi:hypothetical protein